MTSRPKCDAMPTMQQKYWELFSMHHTQNPHPYSYNHKNFVRWLPRQESWFVIGWKILLSQKWLPQFRIPDALFLAMWDESWKRHLLSWAKLLLKKCGVLLSGWHWLWFTSTSLYVRYVKAIVLACKQALLKWGRELACSQLTLSLTCKGDADDNGILNNITNGCRWWPSWWLLFIILT